MGDDEDIPVTVTPVMYWELGHHPPGYGLMLHKPGTTKYPSDLFRSERALYSSSIISTDFISFWRAALLLRECRFFTDWFVQNLVFEIVDTPFEDLKTHVQQEVLETVSGGRETVERIRAMSPPDWLLERTLKEWAVPGCRAAIRTMTRELRAGTVTWRDEFAKLGVLTPEEEDARKTLWEELEPQFTPIIRRLSKVLGEYHHDALCAQDELILLSRAGTIEAHGPFITAALAFIAGQRPRAEIVAETCIIMGGNPWSMARFYDEREHRWIKLITPWVAKRWRRGQPFDPEQITAIYTILVALLKAYFHNGSTSELMERYAEALEKHYGSSTESENEMSDDR